ncbi:hypothetical protein DPMN_036535 [Dreissena polymorpha]|uniref:Cadherin domain-containing protein n=1 Tax=Dreissena polymorpha TaxID=45954 RepID=A0A9D4MB22_DREPO|nr:hypothetical protein DPMN_036535 [Dreissena polymorpha]
MNFPLQLNVVLSDQPGRVNVNTATLTINVIRNQFTPRFLDTPYRLDIVENTNTAQSIFRVTAVDDDAVNTFERVSYEVSGDSNAPAFFTVNSNTGVITLIQSLANNPDTVYNLRITAFDNGIPRRSNSTIVIINVDRNRNTPFFQPTTYSAQVADNSIIGSELVTLTVRDSDTVAPYSTVKCFLRTSTSSQFFFIDADTCKIYVSRNVATDVNSPQQYTLTVGAYDLGTPSRSAQDATVFISVVRNQFSPDFINDPYSVTIEQNRLIGSLVLRVSATDADTVSPFRDVTMRLIGDDKGLDYFNFDPASGNITVRNDLTQDTSTFYQLRLEARDGGTPARSASALVSVNVQRNLFNPEFIQLNYNITIDETQQLGSNILQITARDQDVRSPHNVITYTMSNQNALAAQYFTVNSGTGEISLRQSLLNDNTDTRRYTFQVSISDNGIPARSALNVANVEINVIRNTNPPFFINTPYDRAINYTTAQGALIFRATATDNDISPYNIITYDLIGDGDATIFFRIDATSGEVRLAQSIAQESTVIYRLTIRAQDNGSPRQADTETVFVTIQRNLNAPVFTQNAYQSTILETQAPGTSVLTVRANDLDIVSPNNVVRYFIAESNTRFDIDETTGVIYIRQNLYDEVAPSYTFNVRANDLGSPQLTSNTVPVTITVIRNNFAPVFINEIYSADITTGFFSGASIIPVTATDADPSVRNYLLL